LSKKIRILHVNDHEGIRYMMTRSLQLAGCDVTEATSGFEAIQLTEAMLPDMLVCDVKLPDLSGIEVCRRLKANPRTADVVVIVNTQTFEDSERKAEALRNGADAFLANFAAEELVATVEALTRLTRRFRRREDALALADQRKDEFMATLAHELRNPLAAITSAMALLGHVGDGVAADGAAQERARTVVERQLTHIQRMVDDMLDMSRVRRGKLALRRELTDLSTVVRHSLETVRPQAEARQQSIAVEVADGLAIDGDATRLTQIFVNVVGNASKYGHDGGNLWVSLSREERQLGDGGGWAQLRVRDDGMGIAPAFLPYVFDLFAQAEAAETLPARGGLGIGLTLVKRLVELHGGTIRVESSGLGAGTEVVVRLPLSAATLPLVVGEPARVEPPRRLQPRKVVLVDDNEDGREMLALVLASFGYQVETAADGPAGLAAVANLRPEVAVIDIGLPGIDGYEVAQRIRRSPHGGSLLLVALTGYGGTQPQQRALEAGFDLHLTKPVRPEQLVRLLASDEEARAGRREWPLPARSDAGPIES
jgi:signal transduction histidine kinase